MSQLRTLRLPEDETLEELHTKFRKERRSEWNVFGTSHIWKFIRSTGPSHEYNWAVYLNGTYCAWVRRVPKMPRWQVMVRPRGLIPPGPPEPVGKSFATLDAACASFVMLRAAGIID